MRIQFNPSLRGAEGDEAIHFPILASLDCFAYARNDGQKSAAPAAPVAVQTSYPSYPGFAQHSLSPSSPEFAKRILRGSRNTNLDSRLRGNDDEKTLRDFASFAVQIKASSSRGLTAGSIRKKIPAFRLRLRSAGQVAGMTALKLGGLKNPLCPLLNSVTSVVAPPPPNLRRTN